MGEVGSARYEPALLPPSPSIRVLSYSKLSRDPLTPADGPGSVSVKQCLEMPHLTMLPYLTVSFFPLSNSDGFH